MLAEFPGLAIHFVDPGGKGQLRKGAAENTLGLRNGRSLHAPCCQPRRFQSQFGQGAENGGHAAEFRQ